MFCCLDTYLKIFYPQKLLWHYSHLFSIVCGFMHLDFFFKSESYTFPTCNVVQNKIGLSVVLIKFRMKFSIWNHCGRLKSSNPPSKSISTHGTVRDDKTRDIDIDAGFGDRWLTLAPLCLHYYSPKTPKSESFNKWEPALNRHVNYMQSPADVKRGAKLHHFSLIPHSSLSSRNMTKTRRSSQ